MKRQPPAKPCKKDSNPSTREGSILAERYRSGRWQPRSGKDAAGQHFPSNEEVARQVQHAMGELVDTTKSYGHVAWFTLFVAAYMLVLYLQASTYRSAEVVSALKKALLPDGASPRMTFTSSDQVLAYLGSRVVAPVWQDPVCGDGKCEGPWEFPAFGRFGCQADCGLNINTSTTIVAVSADFTGHPTLAARMLAENVAWNLCQDDAQRRMRGEQDLCWFAEDQGFQEVQRHVIQRVQLPPGRWYVAIKGDLAGRVGGAVYREGLGGQLLQMSTEPAWDTCSISRRRPASASAATSQGLRRLMEAYALAGHLPEERGRALLETTSRDVAHQLHQQVEQQRRRLAALQQHVDERLYVLDRRQQSLAKVQAMQQRMAPTAAAADAGKAS